MWQTLKTKSLLGFQTASTSATSSLPAYILNFPPSSKLSVMNTNQVEAKKALQEAEAEFNAGDVPAAVVLALKAKRLFPNLDGLAAHLEAYRIHSAFNPKSRDKSQWYSILNVKRSFGLEAIRKQFKELRALTHPDKTSSVAAEGAFKLVYKAWEAISEDLKSSSTSNRKEEEEEEEKEKEPRNSAGKEKEPRNSAGREKGKCPECSCQCVYMDSRSTVFECKRCKLIVMQDGKEEGLMVVIRDGIVNINVRGGKTTVSLYGGQSVELNQCEGVELKGGEGIHMINCTRININGSGNISF